jgi:hypothetical protein
MIIVCSLLHVLATFSPLSIPSGSCGPHCSLEWVQFPPISGCLCIPAGGKPCCCDGQGTLCQDNATDYPMCSSNAGREVCPGNTGGSASCSLPDPAASKARVSARLFSYECEDVNCTGTPHQSTGPFAAGTCCPLEDDGNPPIGAEFVINGTLSINSVAGCQMTSSAWHIPLSACFPFSVGPTSCYNLALRLEPFNASASPCPPKSSMLPSLGLLDWVAP